MGSVLLYAAVVFFLSFGIIAFVNFLTDFMYETKYLKNKTVYTIIQVENEACGIENIVRAINFKVEKSYSGAYDHRIIFIDNNSVDSTYKILKRLEKSIGKITVLKRAELLKKLDFL